MDVGDDGFKLVHTSREVFGDIREIQGEGLLLAFGFACMSEAELDGVPWRGCEHSGDRFKNLLAESEVGRRSVLLSIEFVSVVRKHPRIPFMIWRCMVENLLCWCAAGYLASLGLCQIIAA
jgi:hypothetical protein